MKRLNNRTLKIILALTMLTSVSTTDAFSIKTASLRARGFLYAKLITLKRLFSWNKKKAAHQKAPVQKPTLPLPTQQNSPTTTEAKTNQPTFTIIIHGTTRRGFIGLDTNRPKGLFKIKDIGYESSSKKSLEALAHTDPQRFPAESLYVFRWSGKLSYKEREQEAINLHEALTREVRQYQATHGIVPRIKIVAHSHGGNIALNLVKAIRAGTLFCIDELYLLACPAQETTAEFVKNPFFKKIYVIYSDKDFVQILAPQGLGFSSRHFPHHHNVVHAKITVHGKPIAHSDFLSPEFMQHLPRIVTQIDTHKNHTHELCINSR